MSSDVPIDNSPPFVAREVLAINLIRLRAQRRWSQEVLAFEAGLHRTFVAHVERQVRNISLDNVERLARAFGLEAFELLSPNLCGEPSKGYHSGIAIFTAVTDNAVQVDATLLVRGSAFTTPT
jgi:transcriptional regulator with XRE-family HTH domain